MQTSDDLTEMVLEARRLFDMTFMDVLHLVNMSRIEIEEHGKLIPIATFSLLS